VARLGSLSAALGDYGWDGLVNVAQIEVYGRPVPREAPR
jgi:hypothetical protein